VVLNGAHHFHQPLPFAHRDLMAENPQHDVGRHGGDLLQWGAGKRFVEDDRHRLG